MVLEGSGNVLFFKLFMKMKSSNLVKLSLSTVVAAVALTIAPFTETQAQANDGPVVDSTEHRVFNGNNCSGSGGNCLPTIIIRL